MLKPREARDIRELTLSIVFCMAIVLKSVYQLLHKGPIMQRRLEKDNFNLVLIVACSVQKILHVLYATSRFPFLMCLFCYFSF